MRSSSTFLYSIVALVLLCLAAQPTFAQDTHVRLSPTTSTVGTIGQTFSVQVFIDDYADFRGYSIELHYDPSLIRHTQITKGTIFTEAGESDIFFTNGSDPDAGLLLADHVILGSNGVSGSSATAFIVTFETLAEGTTSLDFGVTRLRDTGNNDILHTTEDGSVMVGDAPPASADLSLTIAASTTTPSPGESVTFTIQLTNAGPDDATGVTVQNTVQPSLSFVSATPAAGSYAPDTGLWTVGAVPSGETTTLTLETTADAEASDITRAEVLTANEPDPDSTPGNGQAAEDDQDDVTVSIGGTNQIPQANDDTAVTSSGTAVTISVLQNDTDPDGTLVPSSVVVASGPGNGSASVNPATGGINYLPNASFVGVDGFTYLVEDNEGALSNEATVTITVGNANQAPAFSSTPILTAIPGQTYRYDIIVTDAEGDAISLSASTLPFWLQLTDTGNGMGFLQGTPPASFSTYDVVLQAEDDRGASANQAYTIQVTNNAAPVITSDEAETLEDSAVDIMVLANDTDPDGDDLMVSSISQPLHGVASYTPDGVVTYTPDENYFGTDQFSYTATDGFSEQQGQITVTIVAVNDAPTPPQITTPADADMLLLEGDLENEVQVTWTAATDPDGDDLTYQWTLATNDSFAQEAVVLNIETNTLETLISYGTLATALEALNLNPGEDVTLFHRVLASDGVLTSSSPTYMWLLQRGVITDVEDTEDLPDQVQIMPNYPNPFKQSTTLQFSLPRPAHTTLQIYNPLGQLVYTLIDGQLPPGPQQVTWFADDAPSGIYMYRLQVSGATRTGTMLLLK